MNSARFKAYTELLIVILIWGVAPSIIKFALAELPPFLFLFYRFLITVIVLTPLYFFSKKGLKPSNFLDVVLSAFLASTVTLGLLFYGTNLTTSLDASLISATAPIAVIIAGLLFLHERITKRERFGILLTLIGTFVIAIQGVFETGTQTTGGSLLGNSVIFASNITFAASLFLSKSALRKGASPFTLMYIMFLIGLITITPLAYWEVGSFNFLPKITTLSLPTHLSVIYMAFFSGALAYFLYQKAQKTIETSEAAVFLYLQPLVTAPVGYFWLHEAITTPFIVGSVIIAIGVFLAEWKNTRKKV